MVALFGVGLVRIDCLGFYTRTKSLLLIKDPESGDSQEIGDLKFAAILSLLSLL